jgi:predicted DNA binding protein
MLLKLMIVGGSMMSIIAEFTVPAEQFALYETLCAVPTVSVEIERVVAHSADQIVPYFWISGEKFEEFEAVANTDASVEDLVRLDELEDAVLYRANWIQGVESVVYAYTETGALLLAATGRDEQWELQFRFDGEDDVTKFSNYMDEQSLTIDLLRLYHPSQPTSGVRPLLTEKQRETVVAGLRTGYYEIPRETTPGELAEQFGISPQALSNRFRRAHRGLAESAFTVTPPKNEGAQKSDN